MNNPLENISYRNDITVKDAQVLLEQNEGVVLVDVRTPEEWLSSGCPNLGDNNKKLIKCTLDHEFEYNLSGQITDKNMKILFICEAGVRSKRAASLMAENGYKECYNVVGGSRAWKNNGLLWAGV